MRKIYLFALAAGVLFCFPRLLLAQCPHVVNAGEDVYLCAPTSPVQLNGSIGGDEVPLSFAWKSLSGGNVDNELNPIVHVTKTTTFELSAVIPSDINLVYNGDFELGNTGFTNSYTYSPGDLNTPGLYDVLTNPQDANDSYAACGDHTTGAGNMLATNSNLATYGMIWCQDLQVTPNTMYRFSFWRANANMSPGAVTWIFYTPTADPVAGPPILLPSKPCEWAPYTMDWYSGPNYFLRICLFSYPKPASGNPGILIDDISFSPMCTDRDSVTVFVTETHAQIGPSPLTVPCGGSNITLSGTGSSTGPNVTYNWETANGHIVSGKNTLNPVVNAAGTYTLTVTYEDAHIMCSDTASVEITELVDYIQAWITPANPLDCTHSTAVLTSFSSNAPPKSYQWTALDGGNIVSGANGPNATVDKPGEYRLVVTSTNTGCTAEATVFVDINTTPPIANAALDSVDCRQQRYILSGVGSSVGSTLAWSTLNGHIVSGADSLRALVDTAGTYVLLVTNPQNHCTATDTVKVDAAVFPQASIQPASSLNCEQSSLTLSADSSTTGLHITYAWTAGPGANIVSGADSTVPLVNAPGWYYLLVTDTLSGCSAVDSVTVEADTTAVTAIANAPDALTCVTKQVLLDSKGSSAGGTLIFAWTTADGHIVSGADSPAPLVDAPGTYHLLLTNSANGCTATDVAKVELNTVAPVVSILPPNVLSCAQPLIALQGQNAHPSGKFKYAWTAANGGHMVQGADSLTLCVDASGTYTLLTTDTENGCTSEVSVDVSSDFAVPDVALEVSGVLNCNNTSVTLTGTSMVDPTLLDYSWTLPDGTVTGTGATPELNAGQAGLYQVQVSNTQNGCSSTATISVLARTPVTAAVSEHTDATCFGGLNGTASATAGGGEGTFTYLWSNDADTADLSGLGAGVYTVTVSDGDNCTATAEIGIGQPTALEATTSSTPPSSNGAADGTADVTATGGTPGYTFLWSTGATENAISGLVSGFYTVTIADANGCTAVKSVEVGEAACNLLAEESTLNPSCFGLANGQATVTVLNGATPLTYLWSSGSTSQTATGLAAGTYGYTATDANGCDISGSVTLIDPATLTLAVENTTSTTCANAPEGSATVLAAGGTGSLTIVWSDGQSGATATNLTAGAYTATVTDANGCTAAVQATVSSLDTEAPVIIAANATVPLGPSGSVELTLTNLGITITDNCALSGFSLTPATFDCDELGSHTVNITAVDSTGNSSSATITVTVIDNLAPVIDCPENLVRCSEAPTVEYLAPVATDNCLGLGGQFNLSSGLPSGSEFPQGTTTNTYTFTDASGNVGSCSFDVTILTPLLVTLDTVLPDIGNQNIGGVQVTVGGSQPDYTYTWLSNGQPVASTEDLAGVGMGLYTLEVIDANGCTATAGPFEVTNVSGTNNPVWMDLVGVFPNPTAGELFVLLPNELSSKDVQITVNDITGRRVLEQQFSRQKQVTVDLSAFAEGMYIVAVRIDGQQGVWKVIRTR